MKRVLLVAALASGLMACSNTEEATTQTPDAQEQTMTEEGANAPKAAAVLDPVCEMEKQADWTEYSVHENDTTWFCSPHCKETFDKDPAKFAHK